MPEKGSAREREGCIMGSNNNKEGHCAKRSQGALVPAFPIMHSRT